MNYTLKNGESILSEAELTTVNANERRSSFLPVNTVLDFTGDVKLIGYVSTAGRPLVKLAGVLKNGKETVLPLSMIMRVPFQNADALAKNDFQKSLNAADNAAACWQLLKGRKIRVSEIVTVSEVPYGKDTPTDVRYSVFDLA